MLRTLKALLLHLYKLKEEALEEVNTNEQGVQVVSPHMCTACLLNYLALRAQLIAMKHSCTQHTYKCSLRQYMHFSGCFQKVHTCMPSYLVHVILNYQL